MQMLSLCALHNISFSACYMMLQERFGLVAVQWLSVWQNIIDALIAEIPAFALVRNHSISNE